MRVRVCEHSHNHGGFIQALKSLLLSRQKVFVKYNQIGQEDRGPKSSVASTCVSLAHHDSGLIQILFNRQSRLSLLAEETY